MNKRLLIGAAIFVVAFGFGFFAGMEYKAYQIRSAIVDGFTGALGQMAGKGVDTAQHVENASTKEEPANDALTPKIGFNVSKKGFTASDFENKITFTFLLTNNTQKDVAGVKGNIVFRDIFGDEITKVNYSYDGGIKANATVTDARTVDYNQFISSDEKLRSTPLDKLKYDWQVQTIIYADGSKEGS
jgi:hypothetical protein